MLLFKSTICNHIFYAPYTRVGEHLVFVSVLPSVRSFVRFSFFHLFARPSVRPSVCSFVRPSVLNVARWGTMSFGHILVYCRKTYKIKIIVIKNKEIKQIINNKYTLNGLYCRFCIQIFKANSILMVTFLK